MDPQQLPVELPKWDDWLTFRDGVLVVIGAVMGLFGLGIYHGALRIFGALVGGIFAYLFLLANIANLQLEVWQHVLLGLVVGIVGAVIGSWLAMAFHYATFFLLGIVLGYMALWVLADPTAASVAVKERALPTAFQPEGWQWIAILGSGLIYLLASNWMILLTCAFVGGAMLASGLKTELAAYIGIPLGILVQWTLFLRPGRPPARSVRVVRRRPGVVYDDHGIGDEYED